MRSDCHQLRSICNACHVKQLGCVTPACSHQIFCAIREWLIEFLLVPRVLILHCLQVQWSNEWLFSVWKDILTIFYLEYMTNGIFLHGGTKMLSYLTSELKVTGTPSLVCGLVFKIKKKNWFWVHDVMIVTSRPYFWKITLQAVLNLYIGLFCDTEW